MGGICCAPATPSPAVYAKHIKVALALVSTLPLNVPLGPSLGFAGVSAARTSHNLLPYEATKGGLHQETVAEGLGCLVDACMSSISLAIRIIYNAC